MTTRAKRRCYLSTVQLYRLDLACTPLKLLADEDDGPSGVYLVGSSWDRADFRDVDVRLILSDERFDALFGTSPQLWGIFCCAVSRSLTDDTGLPVDFQVQRMTEANEQYGDKPRNPLGHVAIGFREFAGRGDATRFEAKP